MNGIEKIAARIVFDAQQEAAALKTETEKQAAEVRDAADRQARASASFISCWSAAWTCASPASPAARK